MNSRELVLRALNHQPVPRAPYAIDFTVPARKAVTKLCSSVVPAHGCLGDIAVSPVIKVEWGVSDANGRYVDEFGVEFDRSVDSDIGIPKAFLTPENIDSYTWPNPYEPSRFAVLARNIAEHPDKFQLMALDFSLYERAWALRGLAALMEDMVLDESFVGDLLDRILDFNLRLVDNALSQYPAVDGVYFGDDFGTQIGVIMGASRWRAIFKPRLARQYAKVHEWGKKVFIHSCGAVAELFPDLIEIGVDCFNPFQPEVMDPYITKRTYAGRLAFWGGVSTQRLLPFGSVAEVQTSITNLMQLGADGGYIVAPAHAVPADARPENVAVMIGMLMGQEVPMP